MPMGDKEANAVQRGMNTYCLPTHTAPVPGPSLFHVLSGKDSVVCLPAISLVTSSQTISISMPSQECNRATGEFPHALLISAMKLALSCIWKTSVEFFGHNANCVHFCQCELNRHASMLQIPVYMSAQKYRGWTWSCGQLMQCVTQSNKTALNKY